MITIISDGINVPWFFPKAVKRLDRDDACIVYIPSYDYTDRNGLHFSPGFSKIVWLLSKKHFRASYKIAKILEYLGLHAEIYTDFEYIIAFLITLWLAKKNSVVELFDIVTEGLSIKHKIIPIIDPLSTTIIRISQDKALSPKEVDASIETVSNIEFIFPKDYKIPDEILSSIDNSGKILIVGSALTLLYLRRLEPIYKAINNFKGHIIYVLPQKLSNIDRLVLKNLNTEPTFVGLTSILNGNVDAVVVNSSESSVIQRINELNFLFYPILFNSEDPEKRKRTVEEFFKVLIG